MSISSVYLSAYPRWGITTKTSAQEKLLPLTAASVCLESWLAQAPKLLCCPGKNPLSSWPACFASAPSLGLLLRPPFKPQPGAPNTVGLQAYSKTSQQSLSTKSQVIMTRRVSLSCNPVLSLKSLVLPCLYSSFPFFTQPHPPQALKWISSSCPSLSQLRFLGSDNGNAAQAAPAPMMSEGAQRSS